MDISTVDAIIFDLGGVILNLDYLKTEDAFVALGLENFKQEYSQMAQQDLFSDFETGEISSFHFVNRLLDKLPRGTNANQVVHAWNAMILDFPLERLHWLEKIGKEKRTFLLSNTNSLHLELVNRRLESVYPEKKLFDFFEKAYFSHELGMRKPNPAIFDFVCSENKLNPAKTLFIDDTFQHIEGAKKTGLQTHFLKEEVMLLF